MPVSASRVLERTMTRTLTLLPILLSLALVGCKDPPVNRGPSTPLKAVEVVDLQRYAGKWYEIARFPNSFEEDCVAVTATYSGNPDGTIKVVNSCRLKSFTGEVDVAQGRARVLDTQSNAKLAVSFFWPFEGDYWILALADDYTWVLVGEPSGRYLWILSRTPHISDALRTNLIGRLDVMGYNAKALFWTPQP